MPLQDLSPQLRTRLNRMERIVGGFVILAAVMLLAGFAYYIYSTAQRKGWYVLKINYATGLDGANGLRVGDPVKLLGFDVGEITQIELNKPGKTHGVIIFFNIREPYYGYIWLDSSVRLVSDFLGHNYLEVAQGKAGAATVLIDKTSDKIMVLESRKAWDKFTNVLQELKAKPENSARPEPEIAVLATNELNTLLKAPGSEYYLSLHQSKFSSPIDSQLTNWIWVPPLASPSLAERLEAVANKIETALPNILNLTNQLSAVLTNANAAAVHLDATLTEVHPILTNVTVITENLRNPQGSLGAWLIPTNLLGQMQETMETAQATLKTAHSAIENTDTNLTLLATDLDRTLAHLADLTSNLNWQVQSNTNLVGEISTTIVHADGLIEGLKRHWLLRSAFKKKPAPQSK
jgi:hypothetical protein